MAKKLFIISLMVIMCFVIAGCGNAGKATDDIKLNNVYDKVGEYFGDTNVDRSNLGAYYIDEENNVIVVILINNSKEQQENFKKNANVYSKYIKFVQGGPYTTSKKKD